MKLTLALGLALYMALAQVNIKMPHRIKIRHADPQLIEILLSGKSDFTLPPEITLGPKK